MWRVIQNFKRVPGVVVGGISVAFFCKDAPATADDSGLFTIKVSHMLSGSLGCHWTVVLGIFLRAHTRDVNSIIFVPESRNLSHPQNILTTTKFQIFYTLKMCLQFCNHNRHGLLL